MVGSTTASGEAIGSGPVGGDSCSTGAESGMASAGAVTFVVGVRDSVSGAAVGAVPLERTTGQPHDKKVLGCGEETFVLAESLITPWINVKSEITQTHNPKTSTRKAKSFSQVK